MKKLIAVILVFASVFSMTANAFSFFPEIEVKKENKGFALDYGTVFEVEADKVEKQDDGSTVLYYSGVEMYDYYAYGEALGEDGYRIVSDEMKDEYVRIVVEKVTKDENIVFTVDYWYNDLALAVIIPEGVGIASLDFMSKFADYTEIEINEWFNLPGLGKMRFTDVELNGDMTIPYYNVTITLEAAKNWLDKYAKTYILAEFENTTTKTIANHLLPDVKIHYINEENEYVFDADVKGPYDGSVIYDTLESTGMYYDTNRIPQYPSLHVADIGYAYLDMPERVTNPTDGFIVVTVEYEGTSYVLSVR